MADDDIIKLGADFGDAVKNVMDFADAVKVMNKVLKDTRGSSASFDAFGNLITAKAEAIGKGGKKLKVAVRQIIEDMEDAEGNITKHATGAFEVKVDITKAKKSIQEMGPELKALLAGYIKLQQINLDNLDVSKKTVKVPEAKELVKKAGKAPTPEQIVKGGSLPGVKAGLEAQFGLTPNIFAQASQAQIDLYNTKLNTLLLSMKGMETETKRLEEITRAYVTKTNPLLDSQDKIILKNLRDVANFSTELGKASQLTSTLRERAALAKDVLAKSIQPILTDPKIARAAQASFSFFKIPQPEVFADVASPKEKANVKKISDQIRELIVNNADITKKEVDKAISAIGHPGIIDNLKGPVRELVGLIGQLDQAYERLGSEALAATIKQEAASKRTIASVAQTRNQIEQDVHEQSIRRGIATGIVAQATAFQVVPANLDPQFKARLDIYNSNLLSVQNTAARTTLSIKEIDQVFDAIASADVTGLLLREQQELYSTINTLNTAYDKLHGKINSVAKAEADLAAAQLSKNQAAIAAAQKSLATQKLAAATRGGLPSVTDVLGAVPDFQGRAVLVQKYQNALEGVENTIVSVGATEATLAQAHKSILDPDQTITADAQRVRNALLAVNNIFEKIFAASSKVAAKDQADADKKVAASKKVQDALAAEAKRIAGVGVSNAEATAAITSIFNVDLSALEPKLATRIHKALGNVVKQYRASGADKIQLADLISEATKPVGKRALVSPIADLDPLFRSITNVSDIFNEVDDKIKKVGLTAVQVLRGEFVQAALKAGLSIDQVKDAFVKLSVGVKNIPVSPDIESAGLKLLAESKKVGIAFKDEKDLLAASLIEETRILTEQRDKQVRKDIETENKAIARRARNLAKTQSDNAALLAERKKAFPDVETTLTKAGPDVGRQFDFKQSFSASKDSLIALNQAMQAVNNQFVRSGASAKEFEVLVKRTRDSLKPGGSVFTEPLSPQFEKLSKLIIAVDEAMDRAGKSGSTAGKSILLSWQGVFRLFQAQVLHTALGQLIGDFRQSLTAVGDFQKEIGLIKTLTQDLPDTFDQWSDSIARVANEFGKSPTEVATAAYDALSSQITGTREETEEFIRTASTLARTTGSTTPDAIKVLSAAINGFSKSSQDAGDLAQKFFTIVDKGNVRLSDINTNFGRTTALARSLGVSFEEVGAALVVLTQTGLSSSQAQTQLNAVLSKLTKPTDAFKEAGFGSGEQLVRTKRLAGVFQTFFKLFKDGNHEVVEFFNELRSEQGILTLTEDNADKVVKALEAINDQAGKAKFKQADIEISKLPGVEFARQIQAVREVVTKDLAGSAVEGINKLTKAFGGLDTIAKSTSTIIINAFGRMGDTLRVFGVVMGGVAVAGFTYSIYQAATGVFAFETAITAATSKVVAFGVASKAAFLLHPITAIIAGAAAISYAYVYVTRHAKELGIEQAKAFAAGKEAAAVAAAKITQVYSDAFRKVDDEVKQSIDKQIAMFGGWYDNIVRNVGNAGNVIENFAKDIKSAMEVSFGSITDAFKEGISHIQKIEKDAEKAIEDIDKFHRDIILDREHKDYQQQLQAAPAEQKLPIASQRSLVLKARAIELFNIGKTQEGLRLLKEADDLLDEFREKFRQIQGIQKQVSLADFVKGYQNQARSLLPSTFGIQLKNALEELNKAQLASVGKGVLGSDAVIKARDRVNEIAIRQARSLERANIPGSTQIAGRLKIQQLQNEARVDEVSIARRQLEADNEVLAVAEARRLKEEEIRANAKQQLEVVKANQRVVQGLFKELSEISFIDTKTGKPLDIEERNKVSARATELQKRLNAAILEEFEVTAAAKGEAPGADILQKRLELNELFNKFRTSIGDQAVNLDTLTAVKTAQTQMTDALTSAQTNTSKLREEHVKYTDAVNKSKEALKDLAIRIKEQVTAKTGPDILGVEAIPTGVISQEEADVFHKTLKDLTDELAKPTVNLTKLFKLFDKFKEVADSGVFKDLETNIDRSIKDPGEGRLTIKDFLNEIYDKMLNTNIAAKQMQESLKIFEDSAKVIKAQTLPKTGDGVVAINNLAKSYVEYVDVFMEKSTLVDRRIVGIINGINEIKARTDALAEDPLKLKGATFPTPIQAGPPEPEVLTPVVPQEIEVKPALVPNAKEQLQQQLKQLPELQVPVGPRTAVHRGGQLVPGTGIGLPPQAPSLTGPLFNILNKFDKLINLLTGNQAKPPFVPPVPPVVPVAPGVGPAIFRGPQTFNLPDVQPFEEQLAHTITETEQLTGAFGTFSSTAVSNIQTIVSALNSLNQQLNATRQGLGSLGTGDFGGVDAATQAAAMGGWIHFAGGGLVPVMTTPGEVFISPALARKYGQQLRNANYYNSGGFTPRGTDTQPGYLPAGSFVLRKAVANALFGNGNKSWYIDQPANLRAIFAEGGGHIGFTPTVSPRSFGKMDNSSTINKTLNSTMHINVNGGTTNQLTAQEIGKALQRQVRLGLLKF